MMWATVLKFLPFLATFPFSPIFGAITKYPLQCLIALLLVTNGGTFYLWQRADERVVSEKAAHAQTIENFNTAQREADAKAEATRQRLKREAELHAKQADTNYAHLLDKYNSSILRYKAAQGNSVRSDNHQLSPAQGGDGPGGSTELFEELIISLADAKICAVNTARLQAVHEWAVSLPQE